MEERNRMKFLPKVGPPMWLSTATIIVLLSVMMALAVYTESVGLIIGLGLTVVALMIITEYAATKGVSSWWSGKPETAEARATRFMAWGTIFACLMTATIAVALAIFGRMFYKPEMSALWNPFNTILLKGFHLFFAVLAVRFALGSFRLTRRLHLDWRTPSWGERKFLPSSGGEPPQVRMRYKKPRIIWDDESWPE